MEYDGLHLMVDAVVVNNLNLNDPGVGNSVLESIVEEIGMTMILPPITVKFPHAVCEMTRVLEQLENEGLSSSKTAELIRTSLYNRKMQTYGYSSLVMIAESHLSIHTFPEDNFFTFDCYSCKFFNHHKVIKILNDLFPIERINVNLIKRYMPGRPFNQDTLFNRV